MRLPVAVLAALALLVALDSSAASLADDGHEERRPRPFGSECRTGISGSNVVAYCHNPYPETDHVRLHVECDRWWDIDVDSAPTAAGPAETVRLTGRCWKEVRSAWVSHEK
ncbi:Secreted protein OS=Streptomyces alboniger OX=132473 GN=CP975_07575 PE=4 SV=1 [Streptomyces alboniger]